MRHIFFLKHGESDQKALVIFVTAKGDRAREGGWRDRGLGKEHTACSGKVSLQKIPAEC